MRCSYIFSAGGRFLLCLIVATQFSGAANAQGSMTVLGGNSFAQACYRTSSIAAKTGFSSREDLENCNNAIIYGHLKSRDMVATLVNRGIIKVALEDFQGALRDYQKAMRLQPDAAEAYLNRGNLLFMAQRYDEAIIDYKMSLELDIKKPEVAELNIGMSNEQLGNLTLAKQQYEKALSMIPEWPIAIEKLARVNKKIAEKN